MKMVLLILEVPVCPITAQIIQCIPGYTTAFFCIQNILNLAICYTKICDLVEHIRCYFIIIAIDVALHLLQFSGCAGLEISKQNRSHQICTNTLCVIFVLRIIINKIENREQHVPTA